MWLVDGAFNFLPNLWWVLLAPVLIAVPFRRTSLMAAASAPVLLTAAFMGSAQTSLTPGEACPAPEVLRVVTANVLMSNDRLDALARDVIAQAPDVVVFQELRHPLEEFSPELAARYPYRVSTETPWMTIASALPLRDASRLALRDGTPGREPLAALIEVHGTPVTLLAVHAQPPLSTETYRLHQEQYDLMLARAQDAPGPVVALGDFNATVWSPGFWRFLGDAGLRVASDGGEQAPTHFPRSWLGVRIDHVLVRGFDVCGERVFDLTGSDHRGVSVTLSLS